MTGSQPGAPLVLRYFARGRPVGALPTRVVSAEPLVLWLADGAAVKWAGIGGRHVREVPLEERFAQRWEAIDETWRRGDVLIVAHPGRAHSIWLFREEERFAGWYVNLEAPWQPSRHGFDTEDHVLDVWVDRSGRWAWKDEDELEVAVAAGFLDPTQAAAIRAEGERVLEEWPLPTGWEDWHPDGTWRAPSLPADWAT